MQNCKQVSRAVDGWEGSQGASRNRQHRSFEAKASARYAKRRQRLSGCLILQIAIIATNKNTTVLCPSLERIAICYFAEIFDIFMPIEGIHLRLNGIYIATYRCRTSMSMELGFLYMG